MRVLLLPRTWVFRTALVLLVHWSILQAAPAVAALVPSQTTGTTSVASVRDADLVMIRHALEHRMVVQKLRDYGVTPREVEAKLANMPDQDVHTLATATQGLPSGSDDGIGLLIGLLVVVLLVIVILKLLNKQIVIK
jgi:hypothetical protein